MADVKISGLPASTVPLAGTEVLPIVQGGQTRQVSINNLTAGKDIQGLGLTLTSTDAGASQAPTIDLYRDSASPAVNDTIGEIEFNGEDSAGNKQAYALLHGSILSPTSGAEQGQIHFETATAGALTEKMIIGTTNLVINEPGNIFNVRIEGDTDANLFYTDATNSRVGIGTISPTTKLDVNGTISVSGNQAVNGPAFSAGLAPNNQSVNASTATKITIDTEDFDTNGNYDPTTNYRFTPTVGGYYQISAGITTNAAASGTVQVLIYKNGTLYKSGSQVLLGAATATTVTVSCLVNMNGSSDYVELYCFQGSAAALLVFTNSTASTWFQGSMVRGL
jgi:hypothetical protein